MDRDFYETKFCFVWAKKYDETRYLVEINGQEIMVPTHIFEIIFKKVEKNGD